MPEASPDQKGKRGKRRIVKPGATQRRTRVDSDLGVKKCLALMTTGQWVTGVSNVEVAREHGVAVETVKEWAVSASRIIRLCIQDDDAREDIRARMVATLDTTVKSSIGDVRFGNRTVVAAIETQAKLLGLVEEKHKHDITMQTKELQGLPPAALLARVRDQIAKLRELETKLAAEVEGQLPSKPGELFNINRPGPEHRLAGQRFDSGHGAQGDPATAQEGLGAHETAASKTSYEGAQLETEHGVVTFTTGEKR